MVTTNKYYEEALKIHREKKGKISIQSKVPLKTIDDLSVAYTPGVAAPCLAIKENKEEVWALTAKGNTVAIVTDGSAVLGLGNIGPEAAMPVMEGKAILFKEYGKIDAWPICLDTQDTEEIIETVRRIAPGFGGINLEDISAPRCFEIERRLQDLGIPVFHDDQNGTAVVVYAGLLNAAKVVGKQIVDLKVVINGAGAAGMAVAKLLSVTRCSNPKKTHEYVEHMILCDSEGIIHQDRINLNEEKRAALQFSNLKNQKGTVYDALKGADVFIGLSKANLLKEEDIRSMNPKAIVFGLANPTPEIMPDVAKKGGAMVVATGRSDFPNQINNALAFPGIFRGALDVRAKSITHEMMVAAAQELASCIENPQEDRILPSLLEGDVASRVAEAVRKAV